MVRGVLESFARAAGDADVTATLNVLTDDALIVGSDAGEKAFGRDAIKLFLEELFGTVGPVTWEWDGYETRSEGSYAWFFVEGRVLFKGNSHPYRASGLCRRDDVGEWRLAMFHGSTPDGEV